MILFSLQFFSFFFFNSFFICLDFGFGEHNLCSFFKFMKTNSNHFSKIKTKTKSHAHSSC